MVKSGQLHALANLPRYSLERRIGVPHSRSGRLWRYKNWEKIKKNIRSSSSLSSLSSHLMSKNTLRAEPCYIRLTTILLTSAAAAGTSWSARVMSVAGHHTHTAHRTPHTTQSDMPQFLAACVARLGCVQKKLKRCVRFRRATSPRGTCGMRRAPPSHPPRLLSHPVDHLNANRP